MQWSESGHMTNLQTLYLAISQPRIQGRACAERCAKKKTGGGGIQTWNCLGDKVGDMGIATTLSPTPSLLEVILFQSLNFCNWQTLESGFHWILLKIIIIQRKITHTQTVDSTFEYESWRVYQKVPEDEVWLQCLPFTRLTTVSSSCRRSHREEDMKDTMLMSKERA